ncbi:hypothetical protein PtA15_3A388 [Puccinia triticina]|uniref:Uncharacterized protein n=1 Tax=Puccinia triticina TaxID=208348 RepID=A0ABY7CJP6_9BASI|nr:uncharacterized protein PtA15_3A388 [Puccinia triticina]WAQ83022.1 hypothetical protein PtA15_3A388 [Puccinia triticina]
MAPSGSPPQQPPPKRMREYAPDEQIPFDEFAVDLTLLEVQSQYPFPTGPASTVDPGNQFINIVLPITYSIWLSTPRATRETFGPRRDREVESWTPTKEHAARPSVRASDGWHAEEMRACHFSNELIWEFIKTDDARTQSATIVCTKALRTCLKQISEAPISVSFILHISTPDPRHPVKQAAPHPALPSAQTPCGPSQGGASMKSTFDWPVNWPATKFFPSSTSLNRRRAGAHQVPRPMTPPPEIGAIEEAFAALVPRPPGVPIQVDLEYKLYIPLGWSQSGGKNAQLYSQIYTHESATRRPMTVPIETLDFPQLQAIVYSHLAEEDASVLLGSRAKCVDENDALMWRFDITEPGQPKTSGIMIPGPLRFRQFVNAAKASSALARVAIRLEHESHTGHIKVVPYAQRVYYAAHHPGDPIPVAPDKRADAPAPRMNLKEAPPARAGVDAHDPPGNTNPSPPTEATPPSPARAPRSAVEAPAPTPLNHMNPDKLTIGQFLAVCHIDPNEPKVLKLLNEHGIVHWRALMGVPDQTLGELEFPWGI